MHRVHSFVNTAVFNNEQSSSVNPARRISSAHDGFCLAFVLVSKRGCILSTRKLKLTPRIMLVIFFLNSSRTAISCWWPGLPFSRTVCQRIRHTLRRIGSSELSGFHRKGPVASKFARPKPPGLSRLGNDVGGLSQSPSKTKVNHRTQGSAARDLGWPSTESNRQKGCQKVFKTIEKCVKAGGGHFEHLKWMQMLDISFIVTFKCCCLPVCRREHFWVRENDGVTYVKCQ